MTEKPERPTLLTHLKVFGIATLFGLGAYAVINLLYFTAEFFGLNG